MWPRDTAAVGRGAVEEAWGEASVERRGVGAQHLGSCGKPIGLGSEQGEEPPWDRDTTNQRSAEAPCAVGKSGEGSRAEVGKGGFRVGMRFEGAAEELGAAELGAPGNPFWEEKRQVSSGVATTF